MRTDSAVVDDPLHSQNRACSRFLAGLKGERSRVFPRQLHSLYIMGLCFVINQVTNQSAGSDLTRRAFQTASLSRKRNRTKFCNYGISYCLSLRANLFGRLGVKNTIGCSDLNNTQFGAFCLRDRVFKVFLCFSFNLCSV